jgi:hypothetical protein
VRNRNGILRCAAQSEDAVLCRLDPRRQSWSGISRALEQTTWQLHSVPEVQKITGVQLIIRYASQQTLALQQKQLVSAFLECAEEGLERFVLLLAFRQSTLCVSGVVTPSLGTGIHDGMQHAHEPFTRVLQYASKV